MTTVPTPRLLSLGLALIACAMTSCADGDLFDADRVARFTPRPPLVHLESADSSARATPHGEAVSTRGERTGGVRLSVGAGSVW